MDDSNSIDFHDDLTQYEQDIAEVFIHRNNLFDWEITRVVTAISVTLPQRDIPHSESNRGTVEEDDETLEEDNPEEDDDSLSANTDYNTDGFGDKYNGPGNNSPNVGDSKDNNEDDDEDMGSRDSGGHEDNQDSNKHEDYHSQDREDGNQYPKGQTSDKRTSSNSTSSFL